MDFAQQQRNPTKHLAGIGFVVLLHVGIAYGLMIGLHRDIIKVIQDPLETKIIEEVAPPPPPETPPPPPPDFKAPPPPPSFIPPPEVAVTPPPTPVQTITATTSVQPTTPTPSITPPTPGPVVAAPAPSLSGSCSNVNDLKEQMSDKWPAIADAEGLTEGRVEARISVKPGEAPVVSIKSSSHPALANLVKSVMRRLKCSVPAEQVFGYDVPFSLND
ncbi:energy transducer TonB [Chitinimonas viridis]|uniref:Energy transducer TonB n=2 Tax=Chitinimonas TaxID=240411 RepID=A0ABT8B160_9NEIS|nr:MULTISPECIES: energy transducer TonB [Chitinimonas]MDN3575972.1 energy transducer TonB [Chitinimonas viridis]GLR14261.1 hypothetical protein GCM10007907_30510 [Chitinimonas prasina]